MLGCKQQRQPKLFYSLVNLDFAVDNFWILRGKLLPSRTHAVYGRHN